MPHNAILISNARAGTNRAGLVQQVADRLREAGWQLEIAETSSPADAQARIRAHADAGGDVVVSVGGDGTVHGVIQAIDPKRQTLAIIPAGSGNDIYRNSGQPIDFEHAIAPVLADQTQTWDLGEVEGRRFLNSAGIGLDAHTLQTRETAPDWVRRNYSALFLMTISRLKPFRVKITLDGAVIEQRGWWFIVTDGPWIGGGMHITPGGSIADGEFAILTIGAIRKFDLIRALPKVFKGLHVGMRGVAILRGKEVRFETPDGPQRIAVDGDLAMTTPATFRFVEGGLRVFVAKTV